jgi:hypothetical protein
LNPRVLRGGVIAKAARLRPLKKENQIMNNKLTASQPLKVKTKVRAGRGQKEEEKK